MIQGSYKIVDLDDVWEKYNIRFTVFDPLYRQNDEMFLQPSADSLMAPIKMQRAAGS